MAMCACVCVSYYLLEKTKTKSAHSVWCVRYIKWMWYGAHTSQLKPVKSDARGFLLCIQLTKWIILKLIESLIEWKFGFYLPKINWINSTYELLLYFLFRYIPTLWRTRCEHSWRSGSCPILWSMWPTNDSTEYSVWIGQRWICTETLHCDIVVCNFFSWSITHNTFDSPHSVYCIHLGYSNEVGESFRPLIPKAFVHLSYAMAISYVVAECADKSVKTFQVTFQSIIFLYSEREWTKYSFCRNPKYLAVECVHQLW